MEKDFDGWNKHKKKLEEKEQDFLFKQGEVWWCSVGINVADESCGKGETFGRPVLVLKKLSRRSFVGIPLSTQRKNGTWFTDVKVEEEIVSALLYQVKMFSTRRFQHRLTTLDASDFSQVKRKLKALLELPS